MKKWMQNIGILSLAIAVFLVMQSIPVKALEVNDTDIVNVSVEVATQTWVDVNPAALTWTGVDPGSVGDSSKEQLGPHYFAIQIENIGSHNITHIWFNNTYPSSRPFATGTNASYDAGNFVVLAKEGTSNYYFPNRLEFNESRSLVYLKDPDGNMPPSSSYTYGRFRNTSYEYFWMIAKGTTCSGTTFYLGNTPHTATQTGTTDFTGSDKISFSLNDADSGWCYADISGAGNPLNGMYTVYVKNQTFDQVFFAHWNKDLHGGQGSNVKYFWDSSGDPGFPLVPGNSTAANIQVWVPYGVYEGYASQGTLTVIVNDV